MGIDSKKAPPLPAPTETDSPTATELATDVSKPTDEKSSYSLPEDGTPVTIKTRHKPNRSQTSLLIEYFEGGQTGASGSGSDRKPSVRVRLTPSKKGKNDRIQITETKEATGRKASLSRRTSLTPATPSKAQADFVEGEDGNSISSYASATEESNVSRNQPIEVGIDLGRSGRRRRPASPLIPSSDTMPPYQAGTQSEISAIPTDSFLDGSGPTRTPDGKRIVSPTSDKIKSSKTRTGSRERVKISEKAKERDRKHRSSKSRTSSLSEKRERVDSPRRRSSRSHQESAVSAADSSVVSSNLSPSHRSFETNSVRSGSSKSINNPKLLETVEDAIRRLILPELSALKREQSKRESGRRGSLTSTGTSVSREDIQSDRRRSSGKGRESRYKEGRDRESRHDYATSSPRSYDQDSADGSSIHDAAHTPKRSSDRLKTAAAAGAAGALGGLAAAAMRNSPSADKKERRRRRTETLRSHSRASDTYTDDYEDDHLTPDPPMPLMSEVNPSEVTRASILSADTDRPHSATEELTPIREVPRGVTSFGSTPAPTKITVSLQETLGTQHANISHGDLTSLRGKRDEDGDEASTAELPRGVPFSSRREVENEEAEDAQDDGAPGSYDYYNTQDLPPHLNYEPYLPERRGLSPIYSVSGYTEGGSEAAQQRDSRATYTTSSDSPEKSQQDTSMPSPGSAPSNVLSREFDQRSDDRSVRSSGADYRNTTYTEDSELERVTSGQAIRGLGANPDIVHVPVGLESHVASLIDGSMMDQSVLSGGDYMGPRDSTVSYDDQSHTHTGTRNMSPGKQSFDSRKYGEEERGGTLVSRQRQQSREFEEEYDLDDNGRKVLHTNTYRHSPTQSEEAIAQSAAQRAIDVLRTRQGKQATVEDEDDDWVGAGVGRNKSFKERTLEGREPANTPAHSIDRLEYDDKPKMMASGLPDLNDPMPEIGYVDDAQTHTEPSVVDDRLDGGHDEDEDQDQDEDEWEGRATPKPIARERRRHVEDSHGLGISEAIAAAALGTAAATAATAAANHSRQPSQEQEEEWQRTSDERKRDTLGTNPFDGVSPVANPAENLFGAGNYGLGFHTGSPGVHLEDEGYKSGVQNRTPDFQARQKGFGDDDNLEDPFYDAPKGHVRHFSGLSHGMATPLYDAATGGGIDRIESKDIVALMQDLVARDAQRTARDVEIAETVMFLAREMRMSFKTVDTSFRSVEDRIKKAEGVLVDEIEESEKAITKAIGGPRPYPGSARSMQGSQIGDDASGKKNGNKLMRALKGLRTTSTNDLTRIEEMLLTLLREVDELKVQSGRGNNGKLDNLGPDMQYDQDHGYEPEGRAGTASQASQSGHLSVARSGGPSRRYSENRISTVHEANEEGHDVADRDRTAPYSEPNLLTPGHGDVHQRGNSVPLDTPPQPAAAAQASLSNENTPRTAEKKKHKSSGSSSWFPKFGKSRWSETTASSVSKAFRTSGMSRKDRESGYMHHAPSRSGSDLGAYNDNDDDDDYQHQQQHQHHPYGAGAGGDKLHTGFSEPDLPPTSQALETLEMLETMPPPPMTYMTPEDPKYKVHRNSLNLQHPQPRPGQTEKFKMALESQAHIYDSPTSPKSADWAGSATSLHRFPAQNTHRYSDGSAAAGGEYWSGSPAGNSGPPRPPKEPLDSSRHAASSPVKANRISKLQKGSPLPHHSVESGYGTATATHTHYTGSPKLENRNLSGALGIPTRRPSGPRAMTPKSMEEDAAREERRRKRDTFGTVASQDTDTF